MENSTFKFAYLVGGLPYDLTFNNFQKTIGITNKNDLDLCFTNAELKKFVEICDLNPISVRHIQLSFCRLSEHPNLQTLMLSEQIDGYTYRFCPTCWMEDRTPYMRIEWRFRTSEFCFKHHTDLLSRCPFCVQPIPMHRTILGGRSKPPAVMHLAQCIFCRSDLRFIQKPLDFSPLALQQLTDKIILQKSIISAVLHGYFYYADETKKYPLALLALLLDGSAVDVLNPSSTLYGMLRTEKIRLTRYALMKSFRTAWMKAGYPAQQKLRSRAIKLWNKTHSSPTSSTTFKGNV